MWLELTRGEDNERVVVNMSNVIKFYRNAEDTRTIIWAGTGAGDNASFRVLELVKYILNAISEEQERLARIGS
jgi:hypothetical protein